MISSRQRKSWHRSRTYWLNVLTGALALLAMPEMLAVLPPEWLKWIALGNVLGNMLVRNITGGGISVK